MQNLHSQIITYSESGIIDSTVSVVVEALLVAAFFFVVDRDVVEQLQFLTLTVEDFVVVVGVGDVDARGNALGKVFN